MDNKQRHAAGKNHTPAPALADAAAQHAAAALAHSRSGDHAAALRAAVTALAAEECDITREAFVRCVRTMQFFEDNSAVRHILLRALTENWGRPEDLALPAADLIRAAGTDVGALARDALLGVLLCVTPNQDPVLEDALTAARAALMRAPDKTLIAFHCALARQCFLNEYVFACTDTEEQHAAGLEQDIAAALDEGRPIAAWQVAALASYRPLGDARLLDRPWPAEVDALLTQHIREPREEKALAAAIPRLTPIDDPVSARVARQYEENPYPRYVLAGPARTAATTAIADILVAGCGTGRNAIETARSFGGARVLAVDLSRASLGFAARKAREMDVANIAYAQADILCIGNLDTRFDLIEAVGVLHHLADPFAGWRILLGLLKPGGTMKIGLYSSVARKDLSRARSELAAQGFAPTPRGIRAGRAHLRAHPGFAGVTERPDFFTLSNCRDLLFHVQERPVTLADIAAFLRGHGLAMLGFDLDEAMLAQYRARFPQDPQATDLDNWARFEAAHPATFDGMYQFWVQRI
jgi:SAM-dependent methyltransferase